MHPLKGTTTGEDIFEAVKLCCEDLEFNKLVSVTTDGAPSMVGKKKGAKEVKLQLRIITCKLVLNLLFIR